MVRPDGSVVAGRTVYLSDADDNNNGAVVYRLDSNGVAELNMVEGAKYRKRISADEPGTGFTVFEAVGGDAEILVRLGPR